MRLIFVVISLSILLFSCKSKEDKFIAMVNGKGIDRKNFEKVSNRYIEQRETSGRQMTPTQKYSFNSLLIENLIKEELLMQEARKNKIDATDEAVKEKIDQIIARYPNKEDFENILKQQGISQKELNEIFKKQIIIENLFDKVVKSSIEIPEEKLNTFYTENIKQFETPDQIQASHILLKLNEKSDPKELAEEEKNLTAKLESIKKEIVSNQKTFEKAAEEYSECPSKSNGGDLGLFSQGRMVKEFEKVAFASQIDNISAPFKSPFGYHILKVTKKEKARTKPFEEVKEEIKNRLVKQESSQKTNEFIEGLLTKAEVVKYLKEPTEADNVESLPSIPAINDETEKEEVEEVEEVVESENDNSQDSE